MWWPIISPIRSLKLTFHAFHQCKKTIQQTELFTVSGIVLADQLATWPDASFLCQYFKSTLRGKVFVLKWFFRLPVWAAELSPLLGRMTNDGLYFTSSWFTPRPQKVKDEFLHSPKTRRREIHIRASPIKTRSGRGKETGSGSCWHHFILNVNFFSTVRGKSCG